MTKHTPGPWRIKMGTQTVVEPANEAHPRRAAIAQCAMSHGIGDAGQADAANARLIAAAPELYEALRDLLADVTTPNEPWAAGSSVERARAALAKVEA